MFEATKEMYASLGVDVEMALGVMARTPISLHCWQGDDVGGFESDGGALGSGLAVTGNYPGKARSIVELRTDLEHAGLYTVKGSVSYGLRRLVYGVRACMFNYYENSSIGCGDAGF